MPRRNMTVRKPPTRLNPRLPQSLVARILLGAVAFFGVIAVLTFSYYYFKFARMIEEKLAAGPFPSTSMLFAAPRVVAVGDEIEPAQIIAQLHRSGYGVTRGNRMGRYNVRRDAIEIFAGPDSFYHEEEGVIKFEGNRVTEIISLRDNAPARQYRLEPELITNLFDAKRQKRRIVAFHDLPKVLVHAVISAEDKRFFQHAGFDPLRILKAAYVDLREGRKDQGASTLSMQLARGFWLTQEKTWKRKLSETLITLQLEHKLTKEQIFEYYANHVDLGRRGSFAICGFGEAAQAFFGKDIRQINLAEAATLAGLIQRPSFTNPIRWPERAKARRNVILSLMRENGYINDREYAEAAASELVIAKGGVAESSDAPYFVDLVNEELQEHFADHDFQNRTYRVYTTLDMNLQREAVEAVRLGMLEVDKQLSYRRKNRKDLPEAQVALVALDATTGEVKALVGGRSYALSQLNRAEARRQPGSAFKPFVYAAALSTGLQNDGRVFTPMSTVTDEPTTFWYDGKPYQPNNHGMEYFGLVTIRQAMAKSMNIPAVKVAEEVGFRNVVDIFRRAGIAADLRATPSMALGSYVMTPLEVAGAYTMFSNKGVYVRPSFVRTVIDDKGRVIREQQPVRKAVLDPRVAYLVTNLMEEVLRSGTGAGVRARGFTLPAAGKTGTSKDGWFAGFTTRLLCVVWVGFDDNTDLDLEGARSALPVWTEFMKRAHQYREYRGAGPFEVPDGIVPADIDPATGQLATGNCPLARSEVFIAGTQPVDFCRAHLPGRGSGGTHVAGWDTPDERPLVASNAPVATASPGRPSAGQRPRSTTPRPAVEVADKPPPPTPGAPQPKRGFFGRIRDIFK